MEKRLIIRADLLSHDAKQYAKSRGTSYSMMMAKNGKPNSTISNSITHYYRILAKAGQEITAENQGYGEIAEERFNEICEIFHLDKSKYIVQKQYEDEEEPIDRLAVLEQAVLDIGKIQMQMCTYMKEILDAIS